MDDTALAFQLRAIPRTALSSRMRMLTDAEMAELELATDEALGRIEPELPRVSATLVHSLFDSNHTSDQNCRKNFAICATPQMGME